MYPWFVTTGAPRLRFEVTTSLSTILPALTSLIALASGLLGACAHEPPTKPPVEVRSDDWFMMPQRFMLAHLDQWRVPLHLQTDRPVYRPGDSLCYRGWTLDPQTSTVGNHTASLRLLSADGKLHHVSQHEDRDGAGVLWLPLSLPGGSFASKPRSRRRSSRAPSRCSTTGRPGSPRPSSSTARPIARAKSSTPRSS